VIYTNSYEETKISMPSNYWAEQSRISLANIFAVIKHTRDELRMKLITGRQGKVKYKKAASTGFNSLA
jgi:hypothetical protein